MGEYLSYLAARGNERPGGMIYCDLLDQLEDGEYSKEEAGELLYAFLRYVRYGEIPTFRDRGLKAIWHEMQRKINRDGESWEKKVMASLYATYSREYTGNNLGGTPLTKAEWMDRELWNFNHGTTERNEPSTERNEPSTERNEPSTEHSQQERERERERELTTGSMEKEQLTTPAPAKMEKGNEARATDGKGNARGGDLSPCEVDADYAGAEREYPRSWVDMFNIPSFKSPEDDPLA